MPKLFHAYNITKNYYIWEEILFNRIKGTTCIFFRGKRRKRDKGHVNGIKKRK
jgi:hypothetical protein